MYQKLIESVLVKEGIYKNLKSSHTSLKLQVAKQKTLIETTSKVLALFKQLAEEEEASIRKNFVKIINFGLKIVFGNKIAYDLSIAKDARGTFYEPVLLKNGNRELLLNSGGGVLDVVLFLTRVVLVSQLYRPNDRTLILDECFKNLSPDYSENISPLLETLSQEFHIQFIMITHKSEIAASANKAFQLTKRGSTTTISNAT